MQRVLSERSADAEKRDLAIQLGQLSSRKLAASAARGEIWDGRDLFRAQAFTTSLHERLEPHLHELFEAPAALQLKREH